MKASLRFLYFRMRHKARRAFRSPRPKLSTLPLPIIKAIEIQYKRILAFQNDKTWIALCMDGAKEVTGRFPWLKPYEEQVGFLISIY